MLQRTYRLLAAFGLALAASTPALAQTQAHFPTRTVTIVVGFAPGGGGDMAMRSIARYLSDRWKVPVIVDNRPGSGATIATGQLARARPDGYTVALATSSPLAVAPHFQKVPYDPVKDFTYLFQFQTTAQPLFVKSDAPYQTMPELIAWARANPGKFFWSTAATNGATHLATAAAFKSQGIEATYVPFKGGAEPMLALMAGQIQAVVSDGFLSFLQAGSVRLLAESGRDRIPGYPAVPTYQELGFPVSVPIFYGVIGPAGMPKEAERAWVEAGRDMMKTQAFKEMMQKLRATPSFLDNTEFTKSVTSMYHEMGKLVHDLGMKKD
jgi:tripartite-type tricarboxylate transporter receptor subunit TctC